MKQTENSKKIPCYFAKKIFFFHVGIYAGFNNKLTPSNKPILIDNYALQNKVCVR